MKLLPRRFRDAHKGDCGEVLIVAGSAGMTGAAILASRAALRSGSGLVKLAVPRQLSNLVDLATPEVITYGIRSVKDIIRLSKKSDVIAFGPGLGQKKFDLSFWQKPIVIDADGLNSKIPGRAVITPHPGELARLLDMTVPEIQQNRVKAARTAAKKWKVICVLKGAGTVVTDGKRTYINKTGNPGMATAGMGDVLCGMIASFIGQGLSGYDAAVLGVYVHGLAGDIAKKSKGIHGLIATDVVEAIPQAILKCMKK